MQYKPNQRVAYYRVTGISDPSPAVGLEVGGILIDRPRGEFTQWDFMDVSSGGAAGWIAGERIGFARVDPDTLKPVPEAKLQIVLDQIRSESGVSDD